MDELVRMAPDRPLAVVFSLHVGSGFAEASSTRGGVSVHLKLACDLRKG